MRRFAPSVSRFHPPFRPALLAMALALAPAVIVSSLVSGTARAETGVARDYDLPAGALSSSLTRFAAEAGILLSVDAALTEGRAAPPLKGRFSPREGLAKLLAGSGLEAVNKDGALVLRRLPATAGQGETALKEVTVTAGLVRETAAGPVVGYTARRSATATRTDTPLNEIPQAITVIGAEQIRDQNAQTMQEVLRYTAGVHADVYGLDNRGDWFTLRGGSQGSTLLDGLRLPLTGWYGSVRNEPYAFERVEVLRGPSSVMAGQNGPGGVVNMVSKRPLAEAAREIVAQLGNNNHKQIAADLTGPLNADGSLLYRLVTLSRDSGTQVEYADMERQYLAPSLTWQASPATSVTAYAQYQKDRSLNTNGFFPLEGTLYLGPNGRRIPVERFVSEPDWDTYGGERVRLGYELEHRFSDSLVLRHRLRHDDLEGNLRSMYANYWEGYLPDDRSLNRTWYATEDEGRITSTDLFLEGRLTTGAVAHTWLVGADMLRQRSSRLYWNGDATPLDVYTPTYGAWTPPVLDPATAETWASGDSKLDQWGLLLQDQAKIGERWVVSGALRRDSARSSDIDGTVQKDTATTKNLGVVYLAGGGWSPYVGYSESFEPELGSDASGNAFTPKRGKQFEMGLKWQPAGLPVTAAASAYRLKETGRLVDDPANVGFSVQLGEVAVKGVELELSARLEQWDLLANYTHTETEDKSTGFRVANVPDRTASLWAVRKLGDWGLPGVRAGLGVRHVGSTWDGYDTLETDAVTLYDAMMSWENDHWNVSLNVTNLADTTYFAACLDRGDCWYGTRREVVLSVGYRW